MTLKLCVLASGSSANCIYIASETTRILIDAGLSGKETARRLEQVGADIAMLGRSASISIWAADPEIADALDAMLPELGSAIQRHGLELTALRVRHGTPRSTSAAPGQLLDHAR